MIVVKLPGVAPPVTSDKNASVPLPFCSVIVLSAVGSTTVNVVSKLFAVAPSNTIELSVNAKPETEGDVIVLFVKVCDPSFKVIFDVLDKSVEAIVILPVPSND